MLGALDEVGMRKFEEGGENIGLVDAFSGQMAMRVELGGDRRRA